MSTKIHYGLSFDPKVRKKNSVAFINMEQRKTNDIL